MKKFIEILKDIYGDKRKKALFSLCLWVLFFVVVLTLIGKPPSEIPVSSYNSNSNENSYATKALNEYKNMKNFDVEYKIDINQNNKLDTYILSGIYFDGKYYLSQQGVNYYVLDNKVYVVDDTLKEMNPYIKDDLSITFNRVDINILLKDNLYTIISSSEEESKTNYKDGTIVTNYIYKESGGKTIGISVSEYNNIVNSIVLDFSKYYLYDYKVSITYKNINNISEYEKNYDGYIFKEVDGQ